MNRKNGRNKESGKRIGTMLLSLLVAVSMMPVFAFADEDLPVEPQVAAEEIEAESAAAEGTVEETAAEDEEFEEILYIPSDVSDDSDQLLDQYIDKQAGTDSGSSVTESGGEILLKSKAKASRRVSVLSSIDLPVYSEIADGIRNIAAGKTRNSYVKVTTYRAGINFPLIIKALMTDMPY